MSDELQDPEREAKEPGLYTIGGYIPISGEFVRMIERGEPIVLQVGGFTDEDDDLDELPDDGSTIDDLNAWS